MTRLLKKTLAILLALTLGIGLVPATARMEVRAEGEGAAVGTAREGEEEVSPEDVVTEDLSVEEEEVLTPGSLPDDEILLEQYMIELAPVIMEAKGGVVEADTGEPKAGARYHRLNAEEKKVYLALREMVDDVSFGRETSTEFEIDFSVVFSEEQLSRTYSAEDLGVDTLAEGQSITDEAFDALWNAFNVVDLSKVYESLVYDYPQYLFWLDKTRGTSMNISNIALAIEYGADYELEIGISGGTYTYDLPVAEAYADPEAPKDEYKRVFVVKSDVAAISAAVATAAGVVQGASSKPDAEKLRDYLEWICGEVEYNHRTSGLSYGDPWQIIYVFDKDDTTNVVCEGYAKAFKYLCDLSTFSDTSLACHLVSGMMRGGTGAGGHMWNLVYMGGVNFLVDVTNCDTGTIGNPDMLFLVSDGELDYPVVEYDEIEDTEFDSIKYTFDILGSAISFAYGYDTMMLYTMDELLLGRKDTPVEEDVAAIGETGYATLEAARDAANAGDVIRMLKNVTYGENESFGISQAKEFTLDLNGYTLAGLGDVTVCIEGNSSLTITDSSSDQSGKITNPNGDGAITAAADVTINAGIIEAKGVCVNAIAASENTITINGGRFLSETGQSVCCPDSGSVSFVINGGVFSDDAGNAAGFTRAEGKHLVKGANPDYPDDYALAVDKAELQAAIAAAEGVALLPAYEDISEVPEGTDYTTPAAKQTFEDAIAAAKAVLTSNASTQKQVDDAVAALNTAKGTYEAAKQTVSVDRSALQTAIETAENVTVLPVYEDVTNVADGTPYTTPAAKQAFEDAIAAAKAVLTSNAPTQKQVDDAVAALNTAKGTYEAAKQTVAVDRSDLQAAIAAAESVALLPVYEDVSDLPEGTDYTTPATKQAFEDAIAAAKAVLTSSTPTQKQVNDATAAMNTAKGTYEAAKQTVGVDKAELQAAIAAAEGVTLLPAYEDVSEVPEGTDYTTPAAKQTFEDAIAAAKDVLASNAPTQKQVNDAVAALNTAKQTYLAAKQTAAVDRSTLEAAIEAAEGVALLPAYEDVSDLPEGTDYTTPAARQAFEQAIGAATTVLNSDAPTQATLDAATSAMNTAIQTYTAAKKTAVVDRSALRAAINAAEDAKVQTSADGSDIDYNKKWTSEDDLAALEEAIAAALPEMTREGVTAQEIEAAVTALNEAKSAYEAAKRNGTKKPYQSAALVSGHTYIIACAKDQTFALDTAGGSFMSGANIDIYKRNNSEAQYFTLTKLSDGTWRVLNYKGMTLDIKGGSTANKANVQTYTWNNSDAQKYRITENADGSVTFTNKRSSKVLDVSGGTMANKQNVQQYTGNGSLAQKWVLVDVTSKVTPKTYEGTKVIVSALGNFAMDVKGGSKANKANVQIYKKNGSAAQKWTLTYRGSGYYSITCQGTGKVLDVSGGKGKNGANVQQYTWNGSKAQLWKIKKNSDGTVTICSAINEKFVLDVKGGKGANGSNIQIYTGNGSKAQKWKFA